MEILSPVGNKESLIAAVRSGADAIYFGVDKFNARRNAKNFTIDEINDVVRYCHIRNVKAYLAINTLISDEEMPDAINLVKTACKCGIDALIIADTGLAQLVKTNAPSLPLHASTQMSIHNLEGVKYLKEKGYSRVVLARENSLEDLKIISEYAKNNNIELEIFVSGAHCMSLSGQCLLSSVLGSRSGNRGLCAQPCRLPFKVIEGNGYDLSLKDLNLFKYFEEFEKLGISSLKIEGRMKSEEYVAAATNSAYAYLNNLENKELSLQTLKDTFSRSGFTDGYLTKNIDKNMFGVRSQEDIENSKSIKNSIHQIYRKEFNNVRIKFDIAIQKDKQIILKVIDESNNEALVNGTVPTKAINKPISKNFVEEKLQKTGNTPYLVTEVKVSLDDDLYIETSVLNSLKNDVLDKLSLLREKAKEIPFEQKEFVFTNTKNSNQQKRFICVNNLEQIPDKSRFDVVFVPLQTNVDDIKHLISKGYQVGIKTPVYFNTLPAEKLKELKSIGIEYALVQNISAVNTLKSLGFITVCSLSLNVFNSYSLEASPFDYTTLSVELNEMQLKNIKSQKTKGILAFGKLPLMILRNCPIKANVGCKNCNNKIIDRKDIEFNIYCEDFVTKMINSVPLYIGDKPNLFSNMDYIMLSFTTESLDEVNDVLDSFDNALAFKNSYTRGLYFKGVL